MSDNEKRKKIEGAIFLVLFCLTIPAANWMIGHVGTVCIANGPCLVPVAPNIMAPSGVLMVGAALVLRDLVQRRLGRAWSLAAVVVGAVLSGAIAPPSLVLASALAFFFSELADFFVYTPLQQRRFVTAVIASSLAGLVVDSVIFLWVAFHSFNFLLGQIVGKAWMVLASLPLIHWLRLRDARLARGA